MAITIDGGALASAPHSASKEGEARVVKLVSCVLRQEAAGEAMKAVCALAAVSGVTLSEVQGFDPRSQDVAYFRGISYPARVQRRVRLDVCVPAEKVDEVVGAVREAARTGRTGDGKIFVTDVSLLERIRTGEKGFSAL